MLGWKFYLITVGCNKERRFVVKPTQITFIYSKIPVPPLDVVFQQISTFVELSVAFVFGLCGP